jgi:formate hydrogenlyase transcriptional activator
MTTSLAFWSKADVASFVNDYYDAWSGTIRTLIHVLRDDGSVLYVNQAVLSYTGLTLADVRKEDYVARCFHPEDVEKLRHELRQALLRPTPFQNEQRVLGKDGRYRRFLIGYNPLLDGQGRVDRWYVAAFDIEDRKRAEAQVAQAYHEPKQVQHDLEGALEEIQILKHQLQQENIALREEVDKSLMFEEIVGTSPAVQVVLANLVKVAPSDCTVLITGETGTGKELVARAIHKHSARAGRPFVSVNCAAIPPSLIASELFGHERGAFTGAVGRRTGRFELAAGGTLFLDEVGELPTETQVALLRVLQEREFERVGGDRTIRADVRVIAATNRDLATAVAEKTFRADLFYRLNVFPIEVPALRERREDIPLLVEYFTHRYGTRAGKRISRIPRATLEALQAYDWPGNIRELQNVVERAVIISDEAALTVDARWLPGACGAPESHSPAFSDGTSFLDGSPAGASGLGGRHDADHERPVIEAALKQAKGRVAGPFGAAERLGMPPSTLESKIKALQIDKRRFKPVPPTGNSREVSAKPS